MIATKISAGLAASAIAVAAGVMAPSAHAAPVAPAPAAPITHMVEPALTPGTLHLGDLPLEIWWLGNDANPNGPTDKVTVLSIQPLMLLPGALRPLFGWFESLNLDVCIAGVGVRLAEYGKLSVSLARSC
jgi:hypothetical protein